MTVFDMDAIYPGEAYADALRSLVERGDVVFLTYDDLDWGDDRDHVNSYPAEWAGWNAGVKSGAIDPGKVYVLIQHDTDSGPDETLAMAETERSIGARSSIMTFARWRGYDDLARDVTDYPIDWTRLRTLREQGFCIGYHCNALHVAGFDETRVFDTFDEDVDRLASRGLPMRFFAPHGGPASPITGRHNHAFDYPAHTRHDLRWVCTRYSPRFHGYFSDGGLRTRLARGETGPSIDLKAFLETFRRGRRYRALVHPQYYAFAEAGGGLPPSGASSDAA